MTNKKLAILCLIVFISSTLLLLSVGWKIAVGVSLFGWAMNIDNKLRDK